MRLLQEFTLDKSRCKSLKKSHSFKLVALAVFNLVACVVVSFWSMASKGREAQEYRAELRTNPVPEDITCDNKTRMFEAELLLDVEIKTGLFGLYYVLETIAAILMASAIRDRDSNHQRRYKLWLSLQLLLLYYIILHTLVLVGIDRLFDSLYFGETLAWKISILIMFSILHVLSMDPEKKEEESPKKDGKDEANLDSGAQKSPSTDSSGGRGDQQKDTTEPNSSTENTATTQPSKASTEVSLEGSGNKERSETANASAKLEPAHTTKNSSEEVSAKVEPPVTSENSTKSVSAKLEPLVIAETSTKNVSFKAEPPATAKTTTKSVSAKVEPTVTAETFTQNVSFNVETPVPAETTTKNTSVKVEPLAASEISTQNVYFKVEPPTAAKNSPKNASVEAEPATTTKNSDENVSLQVESPTTEETVTEKAPDERGASPEEQVLPESSDLGTTPAE